MRGWTLALCGYLLGWVPIAFAVELFAAAPSLARRGPVAIGEVMAHGAAALLCATGGWMLLVRSPAGPSVSAAAVVVNSAMAVQSLFWTVLPRNLAPGERLPVAAVAIANAVFWLVVIRSLARRQQSDPLAHRSGREHDLSDHLS